MYFLEFISLKGCPYCMETKKFLDKNKIKYNIVEIDHNNKEKYKTNQIQTFPQIYLKKKNKIGSLLLGGYSNLIEAFNIIKEKDCDTIIKKFQDKFPNWSKKAIIRLIFILKNHECPRK